MPSPPPSETQQFNRDVQFLLKPNNPHARSLLAFIKRTIHQFGLQVYITEIDIFVEAYLRGVRYTQQNQEHIRQPKAWMRRTAYNIIRECKRDRLRYSAAAFDELMDQGPAEAEGPVPGAVDEETIGNAVNAVLQALEALSPGDRDLIQWKVVEGLTWPQVQTRLVAAGGDRVSQATLRKRGQRALERLRRAYHIFNSEPGSLDLAEALSDHLDSDHPDRESSKGETATTLQNSSDLSSVKNNVVWAITLEGNLTGTSADFELIEAIVAELQKRSGDTSLTLLRFRQGSIIIELDGSAEVYKFIASLVNSGQLTDLLGLQVMKVGLVSESTCTNEEIKDSQESQRDKRIKIPIERFDIYKFLLRLPPPQLDAVAIALNIPQGNRPSANAASSDRVACLLNWVESSVGPGLEALRSCLADILRDF